MFRPAAVLTIITACFVLWLGHSWLAQPPTNQEMLANYAKVADYARGFQSVHGWVWWSPSYMLGGSLANNAATAVSASILYLFSLAGMLTGPKLAGLFLLTLSSFNMYLFVSRLTGDRWAACLAGILYLTSPSLLLRLGYVEHISIVASQAFLPLAFWGVLCFFETRSRYHAMVCAVTAALFTLAYAKVAILSFPVLLLFALWVWGFRGGLHLPPHGHLILCVGLYFLLAVAINLPSVRETTFATRFLYAPLDAWKSAFATTSVISWVDVSGLLSGNAVSPHTGGRDGAFLGLPVILIFAVVLFFRREILHRKGASVSLLFLGFTLVAQWLAFGPNDALLAQIRFLGMASDVPDASIAISWLLLAFQLWLIFYLVPQSLPWRLWIGAFLSIIYLIVPGYRLIERISLYGELRAPHDFFHTVGIFCVCVAAGIAGLAAWRSLEKPALRFSSLAVLVLAILGNAILSGRDFRAGGMDQATFDDFLAAQNFLGKSKDAGHVLPFSGRYFYLLTPLLSGHGLVTEAFNSYYMMKEVDILQKTALASPSLLKKFLDITGTTYVLIDKQDPDTPKEIQTPYRDLLPVVFENNHFVIFENKASLTPAFFAQNYGATSDEDPYVASAALVLAGQNIALIHNPDNLSQPPDASVADNKISKNSPDKTAKPFALIGARTPRLTNYHRIELGPMPGPGWVIVPEAFHPDWTATADGKPVEVNRAMMALLGVYVPAATTDLTFEFKPPLWYGLCADVSLLSWGASLLFLIFAALPVCPPSWRKELFASPSLPAAPSPREEQRPPIQKPIVVLPTYNESASVTETLNITLAADPFVDVLVVDDGSPDGTGSVVRAHPAFGQRVHLMERAGKLGLGSAYKDGFNWALDHRYDACIEMDADLSHNPRDIPKLLAALNQGADAAIGSRYLNGVRVMNWPEERLLLSTFASRYVRTLTRLPMTDATSGFKAVRASALRTLDWSQFRAEGYGFQVELHYHLWQNAWKIVEVPIIFTERSEGNTKMSRAIAIEAALTVLRLAINQPFQKRRQP